MRCPAGAKRYRRGTHRIVDPVETAARLEPWLERLGITRVANITGLDVIGIPVVMVCRPNARSNAVFQGKGLDMAAARASGLMEAVETWVAERATPELRDIASESFDPADLPADLAGLPRMQGVRFDAGTAVSWSRARELGSGRAAWVPFELVHADFRVPYMPGSGQFLASTSGLASGNSWAEAVVHGLCELVERDATTLFKLRGGPAWDRRVALASIDEPDALALLERLRAAGMEVGVWDLTSSVPLPVFGCHIMEGDGGPGLLPLPAEGYGCHPDRGVALLRALTEAAQSRLTALSGARDDIGAEFYGEPEPPAVLAGWRAVLASQSWGRPFALAPHHEQDDVGDDLACVLAALKGAGFAEAFAVDLTGARADGAFPCSVVRAIVPGLEGELSRRTAPGRRATGVMLA